jgi:hypothetical protein
MPTKGKDPGHESQQEKRNKGHEMKIHRMGEKEKKRKGKQVIDQQGKDGESSESRR